jgi:hypothetical protein
VFQPAEKEKNTERRGSGATADRTSSMAGDGKTPKADSDSQAKGNVKKEDKKKEAKKEEMVPTAHRPFRHSVFINACGPS